VPYQGTADGLYLARQTGLKLKGYPVTHFGIVDVGNTLGVDGVDVSQGPTVLHQTPPKIRFDQIGGDETWEILEQVEDTNGAIARIREGLKHPEYDMFTNNCEHFAKYVARDTKVSGQVVVGVGSGVALIWLLLKLLGRE
jgi:hypothetical protein